MSRVVLTELTTESVATAANANSTVNSWNTASADIDETNVRQWGLDRRSLGSRAFTPTDGRATQVLAGPSAALAPSGLTQVTFGATLIEIGPINHNNAGLSDHLRVSCSFEYAVSATSNQALLFALGYASASGGPWTEIVQTRRRSVLSTGLTGAVATIVDRGSCTIVHRFTSATSTTLYLALLYSLSAGAGNVTLRDLQFAGMVYAR